MKKVLCLLLLVFVVVMSTTTTIKKTHPAFVKSYYPIASDVPRQAFEGKILETDTFTTSAIIAVQNVKSLGLYIEGMDSAYMVVLGQVSGVGGLSKSKDGSSWFRIMDTIKTSGYKSISSYLPLASIKLMTVQPLAAADTIPITRVVHTPETTIVGTDTTIVVDTTYYADSGIVVRVQALTY